MDKHHIYMYIYTYNIHYYDQYILKNLAVIVQRAGAHRKNILTVFSLTLRRHGQNFVQVDELRMTGDIKEEGHET